MISRPVMRYPGGKFLLADEIIRLMPSHGLYVELFGGGGSVLMNKNRSQGEVYNDLDKSIVNVFKVLRDPQMAAELERLLRLTPFSYSDFLEAHEPSDDLVENARRIIFRSYAGIGSDSIYRKNSGFRGLRNYQSSVTAASEWSNYPDQIRSFSTRLQGVVIENRPALRVIEIYDRPDTLFYADPPYIRSTRSSYSVKYSYEMTDQEHVELAQALRTVKGTVMVSGYRSELYDQLYVGWKMVEFSGKTKTVKNGSARKSVECIWLSPNIRSTLF